MRFTLRADSDREKLICMAEIGHLTKIINSIFLFEYSMELLYDVQGSSHVGQ